MSPVTAIVWSNIIVTGSAGSRAYAPPADVIKSNIYALIRVIDQNFLREAIISSVKRIRHHV